MKTTLAKKRYLRPLFAVYAVLICCAVAALMMAGAAGQAQNFGFAVNEYGLTYGNGRDIARVGFDPELIGAVGIGGVEGYVYSKDLDGDLPATPKEAAAYREDYEKRRAAAEREAERMSKDGTLDREAMAAMAYERIIPLYDITGQKVIGEFGISWVWAG